MKRVTPAEAQKLQDEGWTYLDVRSESEFEAGHPPGAINVPINVGDFLSAVAQRFKKDSKLVVGCQAGGRSMRACVALEQNGYSNLADNFQGFGGWLDAKLPQEKGKK
jgi:rhodanese-related sulfurtransferase